MALRGNQDPSSIYYIHPSEAATTQLVSTKFSGEGFHNWKRSMLLTLSTKNKLGFVNGRIPMPDLDSPDYPFWERCNDLVISWIIFNLDDTIATSVLYMTSAQEIWEDLEERFGDASMAQIYALEQQLLDVSQGSDTVSEFFTKIKTVWDGLNDADPLPHCVCNKCTCNLTQRLKNRQQRQRLLQFMMKLNENFAAIRANILMMQPLPNVAKAYKLFAQEERHKEVSQLATSTNGMAFYSDKKKLPNQNYGNKGTNRQFPGNSSGNYNANNRQQANTNSSTNRSKPNYFCTHCNVSGHSVERCFKIHGYPPGFKSQNRKVAAATQFGNSTMDNDDDNFQSQSEASANDDSHILTKEQYSQLMTLFDQQTNVQHGDSSKLALLAGTVCLLSTSHNDWLIDSGATDHICPHLDQFHSYDKVSSQDSFITIPDGRQVKVLHVGTIKLNDDIILKRVLHVPEFHFSLISVKQLCVDMSCSITFTDKACFIQGLSQKRPPIPLGKILNGLYSVPPIHSVSTKVSSTPLALHSAVVDEARLWHIRLGHLPFSLLHHVAPVKSIQNADDSTICQVCPTAKQTRKSFPVSAIKTTCAFQLLHIDLWGPYRTKSITGCSYFLTIVDDFSRFTWVHLMKYKSEVPIILESFLKHVDTQFGAKVLCIRSDNAQEFSEGLSKHL